MAYANNCAFKDEFDNYTERRKSVRRKIHGQNVVLDMCDNGYLQGEIVDISYEGMFINTATSLLFPHCSIELLFNNDGDVKRAEAFVIRRNARGVGLWIDRNQMCNEWLVENILPSS